MQAGCLQAALPHAGARLEAAAPGATEELPEQVIWVHLHGEIRRRSKQGEAQHCWCGALLSLHRGRPGRPPVPTSPVTTQAQQSRSERCGRRPTLQVLPVDCPTGQEKGTT